MDDVPVEGMGRRGWFSAGGEMDCFAEPVISVRAQLRSSRGAHLRDPLARKTKSAHRARQTDMTGKADEGRFAIVTNAR